MKKIRILKILLILTLASCASAPQLKPAIVSFTEEQSVLPIRMLHYCPMVQVEIGGGAYWFIVDTNANAPFLVSKKLEHKLGEVVWGPDVTLGGSTAGVATVKTCYINELKIGAVTYNNLLTAVMDISWIDEVAGMELGGFIGLPAFTNFLLTIDYPNRKLIIRKGALPAPDRKQTFRLNVGRGYPGFSLECAGKSIETRIDSGSNKYFNIPATRAHEFSFSRPVATGYYAGLTGAAASRTMRLNGDIKIGSHTIAAPLVDLWDRDYFNLGGTYLANFAVSFDQINRVVRFVRGDNAPVRVPGYTSPGFQMLKKSGAYIVSGILPGFEENFPVKVGDVIVAINGQEISSLDRGELFTITEKAPSLKLVVNRNGKSLDITVPMKVLVP